MERIFLTAVFIVGVLAKIMTSSLVVFLIVYGCITINHSIKENDSSIVIELGNVLGDFSSEFMEAFSESE